MFKLNPNPTFKATVRLTVPGQETPGEITFEFRHQDKDALKAMMAETKRADIDVIAGLVADWSGVVGDDGEIACSREALARLLANYPAAAREIYAGYLNALTESRVKN